MQSYCRPQIKQKTHWTRISTNWQDITDFRTPENKGAVGSLMGKQLQVKLAEESGLHVPMTVRYKKGQRLPEGIIYPCIVKPQNSITGKKEILHKCQTKDEVLQAVTASRHAEDFLIQQYIDKEYEVLLIGCRLPDGRTELPGAFQKSAGI